MTLKQAGKRLAAANEARRIAIEEARSAATEAAALGVPETVIAREIGVTRVTVRAWLGKH